MEKATKKNTDEPENGVVEWPLEKIVSQNKDVKRTVTIAAIRHQEESSGIAPPLKTQEEKIHF